MMRKAVNVRFADYDSAEYLRNPERSSENALEPIRDISTLVSGYLPDLIFCVFRYPLSSRNFTVLEMSEYESSVNSDMDS